MMLAFRYCTLPPPRACTYRVFKLIVAPLTSRVPPLFAVNDGEGMSASNASVPPLTTVVPA